MNEVNLDGTKRSVPVQPIVGRDDAVDLQKYLVPVHGRSVIDYEKLKRDEPKLYERILREEIENDHLEDKLSRR
jgi:hypothetical protein